MRWTDKYNNATLQKTNNNANKTPERRVCLLRKKSPGIWGM